MASGLVEKVEKWSVREETTTENGHTKYKKEEERTTEEKKDGETKRNSETTREFSTAPATPSRACIEDRSASPAVSVCNAAPPAADGTATEDKKDSYILSDIDDKEDFYCTLGNRCLLGDPKKKGIWIFLATCLVSSCLIFRVCMSRVSFGYQLSARNTRKLVQRNFRFLHFNELFNFVTSISVNVIFEVTTRNPK